MDLSVLIVTSPSLCHPSTILIDSVIDSLSLIPHIHSHEVPIHIIMDGYHVIQNRIFQDHEEVLQDSLMNTDEDSKALESTFSTASKIRLKKGVIDQTIEANYLEYQRRIIDKYGSQPQFQIHRYAL